MARKLAAAHGLSDGDVIVERSKLEELQGLIYCLQAAVEDVDRDLDGRSGTRELRDAFNWLMANARPLSEVWIEPRTVDASTDAT